MINEKILIKTLKKWQSDSSTYAGLKEPALLQKVIDEAAVKCACEAVQVAAMCEKWVMSNEKDKD